MFCLDKGIMLKNYYKTIRTNNSIHCLYTQETQQRITEGDVPVQGLFFVFEILGILFVCVISFRISIHFIPLARIIKRFLAFNLKTKKQNMQPNVIILIINN